MGAIKFGVNIVSCLRPGLSGLLRGTFFDPQVAIRLAIEAGMDFLMILPIRGMTKKLPTELHCYYCGEAWNAGSFWTWLFHGRGTDGSPMMLHDFALFPQQKNCYNMVCNWRDSGSTLIRHKLEPTGLDEPGLVELHPGLDKTPEELLDFFKENNQQLVVDSLHLIRDYRAEEIVANPKRQAGTSPLGANPKERLESMVTLQPFLAPVFHLNLRAIWYPNMDAYDIFEKWCGLTNHFEERYVIIECEPEYKLTRKQMIDNLKFAKKMVLWRADR